MHVLPTQRMTMHFRLVWKGHQFISIKETEPTTIHRIPLPTHTDEWIMPAHPPTSPQQPPTRLDAELHQDASLLSEPQAL
jgi:hypothetical protein